MSKTKTKDQFIIDAKKIHGDKYNYSKVDYKRAHIKITIICPEHGPFEQTPSNHLMNHGCPECSKELISKNKTKTKDQFIIDARKIHGDKYDYSKVDYKRAHIKITIICPEHGPFEQIPNEHLKGHGCPECGKEKASRANSKPFEYYRDKDLKLNGNRDSYYPQYFRNSQGKSKFRCNTCDRIYYQRFNDRLQQGYGCPSCASTGPSKQERQVGNYIQDIYNSTIILNDRSIIKPLELDIFLPDINLAVEINGVYWHSEQQGKNKYYHLNKLEKCEAAHITLLQIFENEWTDPIKQNIWKSMIKQRCNKIEKKYYARKLKIQEVSSHDSREFLKYNHLQGAVGSKVRLGLYDKDELLSLMSFSKARYSKADWELLRFCSKTHTVVVGAASKLLKRFRANYSGSIITYANRRWSRGNLYEQLGFKFLHDSKPNYFYWHQRNSLKLMSRVQFQKHKLKKKLKIFDPDLTEYANMVINGYDRIWDCGNKIYRVER